MFKLNNNLLPLLDQGLVSGVNFLTNLLLARFLGVSEFGVFWLFWLIILFFSSVQTALIQSPLQIFIGKKETIDSNISIKSFNGFNFVTIAIFSFFAFFASILLSLQQSIPYLDYSILLGFNTFAFLLNDYCRKKLLYQSKIKETLLLDSISYIGQLIAIVLLAFFEKLTIGSAFLVIGCSNLFSLMFIQKQEFTSEFKLKASFSYSWNNGKYLVGSSLLQWVSGNFFSIAAAGLVNTSAVGAVRAIQNLIGLTHILLISIENIVPTKGAIILHSLGYTSFSRYFSKVFIKNATIFGLIILGSMLLYKPIVRLFFGQNYIEFAYFLPIFSWVYMIILINTFLRIKVRIFEKTKIIFTSYLISALVSISFYQLIFNSFQAAGIIIGIAVTQIVQLVIISIYLIYENQKVNSNIYIESK